MKALRGLLIFTGKVMAVTLLYNVVCFLILRALPPLYMVVLIFAEALFFMILGLVLVISSLFSTLERHGYQYVGLGHWVIRRIEQLKQRGRRHVLLRGITLIIIGLLFWFSLTFIRP